MRKLNRFINFFCFLLAFGMFLETVGEEPPENQENKLKYSSSTSFSLVLARGNNDNSSFSIDSEHHLQFKKNRFNLKARFINTRAEGEKTSEIYYSHGKYDRQIGEKAYLLAFVRYERNKLAGYNYRIALSVGGGATWIKRSRVELSSEVAVGWNNENNARGFNLNNVVHNNNLWQKTISTSFISGIFDHKLDIKLSDTAKLEHQETLFFNLEDVSEFRINSYSAISASINSWLALKTSLQLLYEHQPVEGFKHTDLFILSSLVIKI